VAVWPYVIDRRHTPDHIRPEKVCRAGTPVVPPAVSVHGVTRPEEKATAGRVSRWIRAGAEIERVRTLW
jgi:hypothetical protein